MCYQDIYTCQLTCLNADFPLNTAMKLIEIKNLTINQQYGCQLVCTGIEHVQDIQYISGGRLPLSVDQMGLFNGMLLSIIICLTIAVAIYLVVWRKK